MSIDVYHMEILLRMVVALILGLSIGLYRGLDGKAAGVRTHAIVSLGSSLIMIIGDYGYHYITKDIDITRLAAQVVSGVGFIGAGTILITQKNSITGLTSAAVIWVTAALGLTVGIGYYLAAIVATLLMLLTMHFARKLDHILWRYAHRPTIIRLLIPSASQASQILLLSEKLGCKLQSMESEGQGLLLILLLKDGTQRASILAQLEQLEEIRIL